MYRSDNIYQGWFPDQMNVTKTYNMKSGVHFATVRLEN